MSHWAQQLFLSSTNEEIDFLIGINTPESLVPQK